jgi:hypothetical protein
MSDIPQATVDRILARCGRHCCVCRKFRPLLLQVHHIKEQNEGGGHDEDNLIATCVNCHAEVHTSTKLTRRFTNRELKQHRDTVYRLVSEGKLVEVADHEDKIDRLTKVLVDFFSRTSGATVVPSRPSGAPLPARSQSPGLTPEAVEILIAAATDDYGKVHVINADIGLVIMVPGKQFHDANPRKAALLRDAFKQLTRMGLLEGGPDLYDVSTYGYEMADGLLSAAAQPK